MRRAHIARRLHLFTKALGGTPSDPAVQRLIKAFGGTPVQTVDRLVGVPATRSQRLRFASGGEIILYDDVVVSMVLHLMPNEFAPHGADLRHWLGINNGATLENLTAAIDGPRQWPGSGSSYFSITGGFVRFRFQDSGGWNSPGNLRTVTITGVEPGRASSPEADDCPTCADLLVRDATAGVDVTATISALTEAVAAGDLTEDLNWVPLRDLRALQASGLMVRVESQATCRSCHRISCLTLFRDDAATFGHHVYNDARRHPLEAIPPVGLWGTPARIAEVVDAMRYVDHRPGSWSPAEASITWTADTPSPR